MNFTIRNGKVLDRDSLKLWEELEIERRAYMATRMTMGIRAERYLLHHYFTKR